ncbi:MAG: PIG-L deacetylase family protein [Anaerolineales bacterium]
MKFHVETAEIFVPDGAPTSQALARTTHLAVGAHPDDVEILAIHGILACFRRADRWFTSVVLTDGAGAPRRGSYAETSDAEMQAIRRREQQKAAVVGEYGAQVLLDYPSAVVKNPQIPAPVEDLTAIFAATHPEVIYTHNLADKHDTHVSTALRVIAALRRLPATARPARVYGCEVWRDLDWLADEDKIALDCSSREHLQAALLAVFDSQISGGKRYDLATMGRRRANATYHAAHEVDAATHIVYAMDLTPLVADPDLEIQTYVQAHLRRFAEDVAARLAKFYG